MYVGVQRIQKKKKDNRTQYWDIQHWERLMWMNITRVENNKIIVSAKNTTATSLATPSSDATARLHNRIVHMAAATGVMAGHYSPEI